jgi:hypothetical protein
MPESSDSEVPTAEGKAVGAGGLGRLTELVWQALPAVGSAIGFLGFAATIGAAIEWVRFATAGLPATQALFAVPKQELVIVGGWALAGYVIGGVIAVLVVYLIDNHGNATVRTVNGIVAVGVIEMIVALFFIEKQSWWKYGVMAAWLMTAGFVVARAIGVVMSHFIARAELKAARERVISARSKVASADELRVASDAAEERFPDDPEIVKARDKAYLDFLTAERESKDAIREWKATVDFILDDWRADDGAAEMHRQTVEHARDQVRALSSRKVIPSDLKLEEQLDQVERDLGGVFRALWEHLIVSARGLGDRLMTIKRIPALASLRERLERTSVVAWLREKLKETLSSLRERLAKVRALFWTRKRLRKRPVLAILLVTIAIGLIVAGILLVALDSLIAWLAIVLGIVVALAAMNLLAARATEKFAWYGVSVFFSVLLFGATLTIARTVHERKMQPLALVRKGDDVAICGVYVAQTNDRVYVGRLPLDVKPSYKGEVEKRRPGLIFWVPSADVELVSVGQFERVNSDFGKLAVAMLPQLYKDRAEQAAFVLKNTTTTKAKTLTDKGAKEPPATSGATVQNTPDTQTTTTETPPARSRPISYPKQKTPGSCTSPRG